jgi:WD40 repeat protein
MVASPGKPTRIFKGHADLVTAAALGPDQQLATGSLDHTARVWRLATRERSVAHLGFAKKIQLTPAGDTIIAGNRIYEPERGSEIGSCRHSGTRGMPWTPISCRDEDIAGREGIRIARGDDGLLAEVDDERKVTISRDGDRVSSLGPHAGSIDYLAFAPSRSMLAVVHGTSVDLWEAASGQLLGRLSGHAGLVNHVSFDPGGGRIATASNDRTARLWRLAARPELVAELRGHGDSVVSATFSPDGTALVTAGWDGTARLWDPATGKLKALLEGHRGPILVVAFTRDGRLFTAGADGDVRIWSADTGLPVSTFHASDTWVTHMAVTPDGRRLITGGPDFSPTVWDVAPEARSAAELAPIIEALPYELRDGRVVPRR